MFKKVKFLVLSALLATGFTACGYQQPMYPGYGTGYGKVQIFMQKTTITQVKGEESDEVNEVAIIDK